jgi:hypothetical protein
VTLQKTPSATQARNAALINQFATPGLGSLLAGRKLAGAGQLLLAVAGFGLMLMWFVRLMRDYYGLISDAAAAPQLHWGGLISGGALFLVAWLWSLVTSLQLLRAVPKNVPSGLPPRLP